MHIDGVCGMRAIGLSEWAYQRFAYARTDAAKYVDLPANNFKERVLIVCPSVYAEGTGMLFIVIVF